VPPKEIHRWGKVSPALAWLIHTTLIQSFLNPALGISIRMGILMGTGILMRTGISMTMGISMRMEIQ
jgi:hypothetical protein